MRRASRATATARWPPCAQRRPQLVVLDIWLQGSRLDGIQVLDLMKREHPDLPVVMISGHGTIETAVASIKKGAYDFIEKPFKADRLMHVVERALEAARLKREVQELKLKAGDETELVGTSSAIVAAAPAGRQDRAHRQPRADRRPAGFRQGSGGAADPCAFAPRRQCLRRHQLRHDGARPDRGRIVRRRRRRRAAQDRPVRAGA